MHGEYKVILFTYLCLVILHITNNEYLILIINQGKQESKEIVMILQELYDFYGTYAEISRELRFGHCTYQSWRAKGYIPYSTQCRIEKDSKGRFKADKSHCKQYKKKLEPQIT